MSKRFDEVPSRFRGYLHKKKSWLTPLDEFSLQINRTAFENEFLVLFGSNIALNYLPVETSLTLFLSVIAEWTETQLKISLMISRQFDIDVDDLSRRILTTNQSVGENSSSFMQMRLVPRVTANAAFPPILQPMNCKATAVQLVIVVIDRIWETVSPHGVSSRWIHQSSVTVGMVNLCKKIKTTLEK